MWKVLAVLFVFGCGSGNSGAVDAGGGAGGAMAEPPQECTLPNVGPAPRACADDDDCAWSQCSTSSCIKGMCAHRKRADGAACFVPAELGFVGTCDECICAVET